MMRTLVCAVCLLPAPAFAQGAQLPPPPPDTLARTCSAPEFRQFDFWLGRWSVGAPGREPGAVNDITRQAQGCFVQERYHTRAGYVGGSVNWYDPADGRWRQLWIDNGGLILRLEGGLDAEGRMVLAGERLTAEGRPLLDRITDPDGTVRQVWDTSEDGGRTWSNFFTGVYTPLPA